MNVLFPILVRVINFDEFYLELNFSLAAHTPQSHSRIAIFLYRHQTDSNSNQNEKSRNWAM